MTSAPTELLTLDRMPTPIGEASVVTDAEGRLRAFDWSDHEDRRKALAARYARKAQIRPGRAPQAVRAAVDAYFQGDLTAIDRLTCVGGGTPFQEACWRALRDIPAGRTASYGEQAARIGRPAAVRAVGLANGANPIGLIVPCHRVIGANKTLTGYGGGLWRKRWLLRHEGADFRDDEQTTAPLL